MAASFALHVTASFLGRMVEERFARRSTPIEMPLNVPIPDGMRFLARARWMSAARVIVTDGTGAHHELGPENAVRMQLGDATLEFRLVPLGVLRRFVLPSLRMSLSWLVLVAAATVFVDSARHGRLVYDEHECELLVQLKLVELHPLFAARFAKVCMPPNQGQGIPDFYTAKFLERLLREEYSGRDEGYLDPSKGEHEKTAESYYLPAGAPGPASEMGGASEVAAAPIRTQGKEDASASPPAAAPVVAELDGGDAAKTREENGDGQDGLGEADDTDDPEDAKSPAAEEREGWGVRDWYDAEDKRLDDAEIRTELQHARQRLRIDPDDPGALSILSYYQYLAEDFEGAIDTYDRYIALYPDSSAGYNNKALVYKRKRQYDKEEALYRQALALEPDDVTALNNLAVNLAHQGRFDEALAIMKRLETLDPGDPYADLHRSKIHAQMGDQQQAYVYLDRSLQGMAQLDTLHHIEFRQDIRVDPAFDEIRDTARFESILLKYYGDDTPLQED